MLPVFTCQNQNPRSRYVIAISGLPIVKFSEGSNSVLGAETIHISDIATYKRHQVHLCDVSMDGYHKHGKYIPANNLIHKLHMRHVSVRLEYVCCMRKRRGLLGMILHVENGTSYLKGIQEQFKNYITMRDSDKLDAVVSHRRYASGPNIF
jgi:hypothetical protein